MKIGLLNVHILFQKNAVVVDNIGNHTNAWQDYYSCHATVNGEGGKEVAVVGTIVDEYDVYFTVRYCNKASAIQPTKYRIVFCDELYDIIAVDHMNYKKSCVKFKCKKVRR